MSILVDANQIAISHLMVRNKIENGIHIESVRKSIVRVIGRIAKKWMGCFKETLTDADNFVIDFNDGLCIDTKVLIVAATFLIDMMYFEMNN